MNEYYEANMPEHRKPQQMTDTRTVERFIKDKYIKKLWIDEDEEDPVELYKSGELEKRRRKKEKKEKKKRDKAKRKKDKQKKDKPSGEPNLIDFQEGDDFGDFQEPSKTQRNEQDDGFGDLIDADSSNNDFGDFVSPEKKDDDFGDFADPTASTGIDMNLFQTAPAAQPAFETSNNSNLINNLSNLYSQSQPTSDPDNKYAALESLGGPAYPQQPMPQQNNNAFFGMNMNANSFNYQQPDAFSSAGFPNLNHQHSYPPSNNTFGQSAFPTQDFAPSFTSSSMPTSTAPAPSSFNFAQNYSSTSYNTATTQPSNDIFGLKDTLAKNNKLYKYNKGMDVPKHAQQTNAFSNLVATQWNA